MKYGKTYSISFFHSSFVNDEKIIFGKTYTDDLTNINVSYRYGHINEIIENGIKDKHILVKMIIFGGKNLDNTFFNDLHIIDFSFNPVSQNIVRGNVEHFYFDNTDIVPEPRIFPVSFVDGNDLYIIGGINKNGVYLNDVQRFNVGYKKQERINPTGEFPSDIVEIKA